MKGIQTNQEDVEIVIRRVTIGEIVQIIGLDLIEFLEIGNSCQCTPVWRRGNQLYVRRCDRGFWEHTPIPDRVRRYIALVEFERVLESGYQMIDHSLITSLVERWRPETHTFHLPVGEATVTLQDVENWPFAALSKRHSDGHYFLMMVTRKIHFIEAI
ncbi:unnamed protein product [Coffea canephora]|uniref:Aminotransferase-like plant mobile domain-containing protein n=1 Tax=Coffea canephora TaxID=49390 RepID=A0A068V7F6_COFCA|nr:unnamed protein product [Coffea canephora]